MPASNAYIYYKSTFLMLRTAWKLSIISFLLLFGLQHACAMDKGFYLGSNFDYAQFDITNAKSVSFDSAESAKIYAGYNFLPYLGLEIGRSAFSDIASKNTDLELSLAQTTVGISLAGELSEKVDIIAKTLVLYSDLEVNSAGTVIDGSKDFGWVYELGLRFRVLQNLYITSTVTYGLTSYKNNEFDYATQNAGIGFLLDF